MNMECLSPTSVHSAHNVLYDVVGLQVIYLGVLVSTGVQSTTHKPHCGRTGLNKLHSSISLLMYVK